jgi:hypothetical protein
MPYEGDHILDIVGMAKEAVAHAAPGRVCALGILKVKARTGKRFQCAGVIVVEMRQDDVVDLRRLNADQPQGAGRKPQKLASTRSRGLRSKACVDYESFIGPARHPNKIIERGSTLVHIAANKIVRHLASTVMRIADCE